MVDAPDATLLEQARAGDTGALEALLERHQAQIYRFGMKMCRDPEDAKDVLQDTLLAVARNVRDFRGGSSISTWLYSIARSFCIKKRRRGRSAAIDEALGLEVLTSLPDARQPADEALAQKRVAQVLEQAIASLEPPYREVLVLRDVEGLTAPEVAEVLSISVEAVKSRLHRARVSVRAAVAPLLDPSAPAAVTPGDCPDVLTLFSQHLEGDIDTQVCAEMERHLARCTRCKAACESLKRSLALCRTMPAAQVLPAEVASSVRVALRDFLGEKRPRPSP